MTPLKKNPKDHRKNQKKSEKIMDERRIERRASRNQETAKRAFYHWTTRPRINRWTRNMIVVETSYDPDIDYVRRPVFWLLIYYVRLESATILCKIVLVHISRQYDTRKDVLLSEVLRIIG